MKLLLEMQEAQDNDDEEEYAKQKLAELTTAYEILSDDHTRLLYHKYGLIGGTDAAIQFCCLGDLVPQQHQHLQRHHW